jgi:hypothetical protein
MCWYHYGRSVPKRSKCTVPPGTSRWKGQRTHRKHGQATAVDHTEGAWCMACAAHARGYRRGATRRVCPFASGHMRHHFWLSQAIRETVRSLFARNGESYERGATVQCAFPCGPHCRETLRHAVASCTKVLAEAYRLLGQLFLHNYRVESGYA